MCRESMNLKATLVFACYLLVIHFLGSSFVRTAAASPTRLVKSAIVGLQHRNFDEELAPNWSLEDRLEAAVKRSNSRKARIERQLSTKVLASWNVNKTRGRTGGVRKQGKAKTGEGRANGTGEGRANGTEEKARGFAAEVEAGDGAFLTSIYIGTPPVRVRAILDTGSDLVWQQCMPCYSCFVQPDLPVFNPSLSSSFKRANCSDRLCQQLLRSSSSPSPSSPCGLLSPNVSCQFTYMYGDNSFTSGELAFDTLTLPDPHGQERVQVTEFAFGCGYANRGASFIGADGILGMGQGDLSLVSQLSSPSFSYCLTSLSTSGLSPLVLGDHATDFSTERGSQVQVTSMLRNKFMPTFYYLNLTGLSVDGVRLDIPMKTFSLKANGSGGMIIDSGTTITYLQEHGYRVVLKAIQSKIVSQSRAQQSMFGMDLCVLPSNVSMLPNLTFHFDGANMEIPSTSLFVQVTGIYCLALGSSRDLSILGNVQQQNYHILFDRSKQRVSFVHTSCEQVLT